MEEQIEIKEQPKDSCSVNLAAANDVDSNDESVNGSLYGKFKDANSLYSGYQELEKEFTKKSQLLSELQKSIEIDNAPKVPIYKKENWQSEVDSYMSNKKYASTFATDVARTLMQDESLACEPNCLDLAYSKVLASHYVSAEDMAKDKEFLKNYIYNNEDVKSEILNQYLTGLKKNTTPPIILKNCGDSVGVISPTKPKSLGEARKLVEQLFK